ncbi:hypothetical protein GUJ93_ZPchr0738g18693 [Zizania palustris]|uniref:Protein TIFY n=1 Tax=Zizania palustris TaxID=103762 RepID=A0A8J5QZJ6_ZIZPA|nr:hypothetical protein GUJ93_ZPchr0738g18693 [Zizania palustris]
MAGGEQQAATGNGNCRFAVTCGLLRQYMKEHGGSRLLPAVPMSLMITAADAVVVAGGAAAAAVEEDAPGERKTMELFPQQAGTTLKGSQEIKGMRRSTGEKETEKAPQLTIFYGGNVLAFDDFPANKADELMKLAGSRDTAAAGVDAGAAAACCLSLPDMPIARKVSLQRFLEKRKSRLATTEPLQAASPPESEKEESSKRAKKDDVVATTSWLGSANHPTLSL